MGLGSLLSLSAWGVGLITKLWTLSLLIDSLVIREILIGCFIAC